MQVRKRFVGVALAASLLGSVLAAPAAIAGGPSGPYAAYCNTGGSSGFTNTTGKTRTFAYVWRQGTTVLGGGYIRLTNGSSFGPASTPGSPDRFGVVTNSTTYEYITC